MLRFVVVLAARTGGCWVGAVGLGLLVAMELAAGRPSMPRCPHAPTTEVTPPPPPSPAPLPTSLALRVGQAEASVEFWQDGTVIPREDGTYDLEPHPFSVRLRGDVGDVSYFAAPAPQVAHQLAALDRPLVLLTATSVAQAPGEMLEGHLLEFIGSPLPIPADPLRREIESLFHNEPDPDGLGRALHDRYGQLPRVFGYSRGHFVGLLSDPVPEDATTLEVEIESIEGQRSGCTALTLFIEEPEPGHALRDVHATAFESVTVCFDGHASDRGMLAMAARPRATIPAHDRARGSSFMLAK